MSERCWRIEGRAEDWSVDYDEESDELVITNRPEITLMPALFFPKSDLPEVVERFRWYLEQR